MAKEIFNNITKVVNTYVPLSGKQGGMVSTYSPTIQSNVQKTTSIIDLSKEKAQNIKYESASRQVVYGPAPKQPVSQTVTTKQPQLITKNPTLQQQVSKKTIQQPIAKNPTLQQPITKNPIPQHPVAKNPTVNNGYKTNYIDGNK